MIRDTGWYSHQNTSLGGQIDVDDTDGYGPENYWLSLEQGDRIPEGEFEINVHYYEIDGNMDPVPYRVDIVFDEAQPNERRQTLFGTLEAFSDNDSDSPTNIRTNNAWAHYDPDVNLWPNPSTGEDAFGLPVAIISNTGTGEQPYLEVTFP